MNLKLTKTSFSKLNKKTIENIIYYIDWHLNICIIKLFAHIYIISWPNPWTNLAKIFWGNPRGNIQLKKDFFFQKKRFSMALHNHGIMMEGGGTSACFFLQFWNLFLFRDAREWRTVMDYQPTTTTIIAYRQPQL